MLDLTIPFPITCLDGRELLRAGNVLNDNSANDIALRGKEQNYPVSCLMEHHNIRADLETFMHEKPYDFMFGGSTGIRAHIRKVGEVPVPIPLLQALDNFRVHDYYTYRHSLTVFALTSFLMIESRPAETVGKHVLLVGPTHDLGKLFIPKRILQKSTPLHRSERKVLEFHSLAGYVMLSYYLGDHHHPAALVALNHHERRNGTGYPRGITELDPLVEMVAACDVYDALISARPYRSANFDNRSALEELTAVAAAGGLDWQCIKALVGRNRAGRPSPGQVDLSLEIRGNPPAENCYAQTVEELQSPDARSERDPS